MSAPQSLSCSSSRRIRSSFGRGLALVAKHKADPFASQLEEAVCAADIERISSLLDQGADPNFFQDVPLLCRVMEQFPQNPDCYKTNKSILEFLLSRGADPNRIFESDTYGALFPKENGLSCPLIVAMKLDDVGLFSILMQHGARLHHKIDRKTKVADCIVLELAHQRPRSPGGKTMLAIIAEVHPEVIRKFSKFLDQPIGRENSQEKKKPPVFILDLISKDESRYRSRHMQSQNTLISLPSSDDRTMGYSNSYESVADGPWLLKYCKQLTTTTLSELSPLDEMFPDISKSVSNASACRRKLKSLQQRAQKWSDDELVHALRVAARRGHLKTVMTIWRSAGRIPIVTTLDLAMEVIEGFTAKRNDAEDRRKLLLWLRDVSPDRLPYSKGVEEYLATQESGQLLKSKMRRAPLKRAWREAVCYHVVKMLRILSGRIV